MSTLLLNGWGTNQCQLCWGPEGFLPSAGEETNRNLFIHRTFALKNAENKINVRIKDTFQICRIFIFSCCCFLKLLKVGLVAIFWKEGCVTLSSVLVILTCSPKLGLPCLFSLSSTKSLLLTVLQENNEEERVSVGGSHSHC